MTGQGAQPDVDKHALLISPTEIIASGTRLTFQATPYINGMPQILESLDDRGACAGASRLIVPVKVSVPALPQNVLLGRVWLHYLGNWWSGNFSPNEIRSDDEVTYLVARGCARMPAYEFVDVIIEVQDGENWKYLRTSPVKTFIAS